MWRKGNALTLLIGMETGTATLENSVEMLLKTGKLKLRKKFQSKTLSQKINRTTM